LKGHTSNSLPWTIEGSPNQSPGLTQKSNFIIENLISETTILDKSKASELKQKEQKQ